MPKKTSKKIPNKPPFHPSHNHLEEQDSIFGPALDLLVIANAINPL